MVIPSLAVTDNSRYLQLCLAIIYVIWSTIIDVSRFSLDRSVQTSSQESTTMVGAEWILFKVFVSKYSKNELPGPVCS